MGDNDHYKRLTISLPQELYEKFENFRERLDMSRSDAVRKAMFKFLITPDEEKEENKKYHHQNVTGIVTYVEESHVHAHPPEPPYIHQHSHSENHSHGNDTEGAYIHTHEEEDGYYHKVEKIEYIRANEIQHEFLDVIKSSLHIHVGPDSCMEIIACMGSYERVQDFYDKIRSLKTLKNCEMLIMDILD